MLDHEIEKILLEEGHVKSIEHAGYDLPSDTISADLWGGKQRSVKEIERVITFLNMKYVVDDFGQDHSSRRGWYSEIRSSKGEDTYEYLQRNAALSYGSIMPLPIYLSDFVKEYQGNEKEGFQALVEDTKKLISEGILKDEKAYNSVSTPQKFEAVKELKSSLYQIIEFIHQNN